MPNLVAYARISGGRNQVADVSNSIPAQLDRIRSFAAREGHTIIGEHVDIQTGANLHREGITAAMAQATKHGAILCTISIARLGRSVRDVLDCCERLHKANASYLSLGEMFQSNSSMGRLLTAILSATAAWELETIRDRTRSTLGHMRKLNRRISRCVYGYDVQGADLIPNPVEQSVIAEMTEMRAAGTSFDSIATNFNERAIPAKLGGAWSGRAVRLVLARLAKLNAA